MQLSSISDDELVDIFAEIGMIDKPVHVLRFQKTLNEWNTNPQEIVKYYYLPIRDSNIVVTEAPCISRRNRATGMLQ